MLPQLLTRRHWAGCLGTVETKEAFQIPGEAIELEVRAASLQLYWHRIHQAR